MAHRGAPPPGDAKPDADTGKDGRKVDPGDVNWNVRPVVRARTKKGGHQGQFEELAPKVELAAGLPAISSLADSRPGGGATAEEVPSSLA